MSRQATLFGTYFGIGLVLMIVVLIAGRAKRGLKIADPFVDAGPIAASMLIVIALLWPVWLLWLFFKKDEDAPKR